MRSSIKLKKLWFVCLACLFSTGNLAKGPVILGSNQKTAGDSVAHRASVVKLGKNHLNGESFNWLYKKYAPRKTHTKREFSEQLADNWLLYQHTLLVSPEALQLSPVDYSLAWYLERHLLNYCQASLADKEELKNSKSSEWFDKLDELHLKKLVQHFELKSKLGFELTPKQRSKLAKVPIAHFGRGNVNVNTNKQLNHQELSLLTLFDRLSIQDKQRLFDGDVNLLKREIGIWLGYREYCRQVPQAELLTMQNILESLHFRHKLLDHYAISLEQHGDNKALDRYRSKVTDKAVKKYYKANKENFRFLRSSLYSFYQFSSQKKAAFFRQNFSIYDAKKDARWIDIDSNLNTVQSWLNNFAFSLPNEHLSNPIRSPDGDWFIVYVFDKKFAYYPEDSETVRYQASNFLAKKYAKIFFMDLLKKLRKEHRVEINV